MMAGFGWRTALNGPGRGLLVGLGGDPGQEGLSGSVSRG